MTPEQVIYQAIGEASMCWKDRPTGIFDSDRAKEIGDRLWNQYKALESRLQKLEKVVDKARNLCANREMWWVTNQKQSLMNCLLHMDKAIAELDQP